MQIGLWTGKFGCLRYARVAHSHLAEILVGFQSPKACRLPEEPDMSFVWG
jgi:hypothetical protein